LLQLYRNELANSNRRVFLRLVGRRSNRDAIGACITAWVDGSRQMVEVRSASGFQSQSPREVFLGLGDAARIDRLEIAWPSGTDQVFEGLVADRFYRIDESEGILEARPLERRRPTATLVTDAPLDIRRRSIFTRRRTAPEFDAPTTAKTRITSAEVFAGPTLVSFATTWLPSFDPHVESIERLKEKFPSMRGVVMMVHLEGVEIDVERMRPHLERPLDYALVGYETAVAYADHSNVLFPSSFLVVDGEIVLDLIGKLDEREAAEQIARVLDAH